eukprot:352223-Chlamydomonas_euryale.AAC.18
MGSHGKAGVFLRVRHHSGIRSFDRLTTSPLVIFVLVVNLPWKTFASGQVVCLPAFSFKESALPPPGAQ